MSKDAATERADGEAVFMAEALFGIEALIDECTVRSSHGGRSGIQPDPNDLQAYGPVKALR
jgi:hypothetical protein